MVACRRTGSAFTTIEPGLKNDDWTTSTDPEGTSDRGSERRDAVCPVSIQGKAALKELLVDRYKRKGLPGKCVLNNLYLHLFLLP